MLDTGQCLYTYKCMYCMCSVCAPLLSHLFADTWETEAISVLGNQDAWVCHLPHYSPPMVHCSAMRKTMKDTGSWVGSRWGRVKQSGVTGFFYNPTGRPLTRAFTPALGHPPHYPRTSLSAHLLWPRQPLTSGYLRLSRQEAGEKPAALF